jgi:branched-chain amino acid transport system ATP-binding protein
MTSSSPALQVADLNVYYGRLHVVQHVSFALGRGQGISIVGRNGAGRTSLLHAIMGIAGRAGSVEAGGVTLPAGNMRAAVAAGVGLVPEQRSLFPTMTVRQNLSLGSIAPRRAGGLLWAGRHNLDQVFEIFPALATRQHQLAGTLSGGQMQMVAIGRLIAAGTRTFLLDSLSLGLSPVVADAVYDAVCSLKKQGCSFVVVEDDMTRSVATALADRVYAMESGEFRRSFEREEAVRNPEAVAAAYL